MTTNKTTAKKTTAKKTAKTSSQKRQPARTKASGKAVHPANQLQSESAIDKRTATFESEAFSNKCKEVLAARGGFKRTAKRDFDKLSASQQRDILIKREYHTARRDKNIANPYAHARAIVEKMLADK